MSSAPVHPLINVDDNFVCFRRVDQLLEVTPPTTDDILPITVGETFLDGGQYHALVLLTLYVGRGLIRIRVELVQGDVDRLAAGCP